MSATLSDDFSLWERECAPRRLTRRVLAFIMQGLVYSSGGQCTPMYVYLSR